MKFYLLCILFFFSPHVFSKTKIKIGTISSRTAGDAFGKISYEIYAFENNQWTRTHSDSMSLGDCEFCSRGLSGSFLLSNGIDRYLGYGGFSIEVQGDSLEKLYVNYASLGKLFRNGQTALVGTSNDATKIPLRIDEPFEVTFTIESANPFGTEQVGPNASAGPETHKAVVWISSN